MLAYHPPATIQNVVIRDCYKLTPPPPLNLTLLSLLPALLLPLLPPAFLPPALILAATPSLSRAALTTCATLALVLMALRSTWLRLAAWPSSRRASSSASLQQ